MLPFHAEIFCTVIVHPSGTPSFSIRRAVVKRIAGGNGWIAGNLRPVHWSCDRGSRLLRLNVHGMFVMALAQAVRLIGAGVQLSIEPDGTA